VGLGAIVAAALLTLGGCATNPATGESQIAYLSEPEEIRIGEEAEPQFIEQNGGQVPSPELLAYVSNLGERLAEVSERPDLPWEFNVLNTQTINAFALPGGKVFITRGLLSKMTNEAQLAGVLGHEIGHVTAKHINDRMVAQLGVQLAAIGLGVAGEVTDEDWLKMLGVGTSVGGGVFLLKFSRDDELQADELGVRYMTKLDYDPRGQVQVMQILKEAAGGGGGTPEFLRTHPLAETRIDRLQEHIADQYPAAMDPGSDRFQLNESSFERNVVAVLQDLPPAPAVQTAPQALATPLGCTSCGGRHSYAVGHRP
jgi:predicted Zn-dependent protease